jgi:hypothetical protein
MKCYQTQCDYLYFKKTEQVKNILFILVRTRQTELIVPQILRTT